MRPPTVMRVFVFGGTYLRIDTLLQAEKPANPDPGRPGSEAHCHCHWPEPALTRTPTPSNRVCHRLCTGAHSHPQGSSSKFVYALNAGGGDIDSQTRSRWRSTLVGDGHG